MILITQAHIKKLRKFEQNVDKHYNASRDNNNFFTSRSILF